MLPGYYDYGLSEKEIACQLEIEGKTIPLVHGLGMINSNMATMLAFYYHRC